MSFQIDAIIVSLFMDYIRVMGRKENPPLILGVIFVNDL